MTASILSFTMMAAKKLWQDKRDLSSPEKSSCECCADYKQWKVMHPDSAKELQTEADLPHYYQCQLSCQL